MIGLHKRDWLKILFQPTRHRTKNEGMLHSVQSWCFRCKDPIVTSKMVALGKLNGKQGNTSI